jgi:UPF0755 protein
MARDEETGREPEPRPDDEETKSLSPHEDIDGDTPSDSWDEIDAFIDPFDPSYRPPQGEEDSANDQLIKPGEITRFLASSLAGEAPIHPERELTHENSAAEIEPTPSDETTGDVVESAHGEGDPLSEEEQPFDEAANVPTSEAMEEGLAAALGVEPPPTPNVDETPAATESFFPIPDEVAPPSAHEDTAEIVHRRRRRRPRTGASGPISTLLNLLLWFVLIVFLLLLGTAALYGKYARDRLYAEQPEIERTFIVTVNQGDRLPQIIDRLREKRLLRSYMGVDDAYLLKFLARVNENSHQIKAGIYKFNSTMGLNDVYAKLVKGSQDFKITIPEGKTVAETADILKSKIEDFDTGRFVDLARNPAFIKSLKLDIPSLEGYLMPSTYFFGPAMREEELMRKMVEAFEVAVKESLQSVANDDFSFQEHLIMASLIEREARLDEDRPIIASVIFNRLKKEMPLQIDATVHYALKDWSRPLTFADLKIDSPYNTYKHKGLPPGPICSPRIASLRATYETQPTDYLFYVLKGDGKHAFAATGAEHEKNVQFYRKSLKEARREEKKSEASDEEHNSGVPEKTETSDSSNASADVNSSGSKSTNDENSSGVESLEIESPSSDSKVKPKGEVVVEKANSRKSPVPEKTPSKPKKKD